MKSILSIYISHLFNFLNSENLSSFSSKYFFFISSNLIILFSSKGIISFSFLFLIFIFCLAIFNSFIKEFICNALLNLIDVFHWKLSVLKFSISLKSKELKLFSVIGIIFISSFPFKESKRYEFSSPEQYIFCTKFLFLLFMTPKFFESNCTLNSGNL